MILAQFSSAMVEADHRYTIHVHAVGPKPRRNAAPPPNPSPARRRVCFSFAAYARSVIDHLCNSHVEILPGLSDEEFSQIEEEFGFKFPPDLRGIISEGVPVGDGFPDWRSGEAAHLRSRLNSPIQGLCQEVAEGTFWWKNWGSRPADDHQAVEKARSALTKAPILVPIYNHYYMPCTPTLAGNPVLSVDRKNVQYCGNDLADFFQKEAFIPQDYGSGIHPQPHPHTDCKEADGMKESFNSHEAGMTMDGEQEIFNKRRPKESISVKHKLKSLRIRLEESGWRWEGFKRGGEALGKPSIVAAANKNSEAQDEDSLQNLKHESSSWMQNDRRHESGSRSAEEVSPRNSVGSAELSRNSIDVMCRCMNSPLARKQLMPLTIPAPAWAAKTARHIEFWSDLVEKRLTEESAADPWNLPHVPKTDDTLEKEDLVKGQKDNVVDIQRSLTSKWVARYLEKLADQLRDGGWKEKDIVEMVDAGSFSKTGNYLAFDRESVLDDLTTRVKILSISLKEAGWTAQEVSDTLGSPPEKANAKVSPQFAAKLGKLAEHLARA